MYITITKIGILITSPHSKKEIHNVSTREKTAGHPDKKRKNTGKECSFSALFIVFFVRAARQAGGGFRISSREKMFTGAVEIG